MSEISFTSFSFSRTSLAFQTGFFQSRSFCNLRTGIKSSASHSKLTQLHLVHVFRAQRPFIASRLSRAKIKCSICSSQFNTWDAQHRWALVLIVCLNRGRDSKLALRAHGLSRYCSTSGFGPHPPPVGCSFLITLNIQFCFVKETNLNFQNNKLNLMNLSKPSAAESRAAKTTSLIEDMAVH